MGTLTGKTVVVTRPEKQSGELVRRIQERGGKTVLFPMIELLPPASWDECDRAMERLDIYEGLLFTSVNGVEYFFRRVNELGVAANGIRSRKTYVVGPKTRAAAERQGLSVLSIPQRFTAQNLAQTLKAEIVRGKKFLFPRGDKGRDLLAEDLQRKGALVDVVTVYRTEYVRPHVTEQIRSMILNAQVDVITFTSPSAVRNFVSLFSKNDRERFRNFCKIAVIGPVTNEAAAAANMPADIVAVESTIESLVHALETFPTDP